MPYTDNQYLDPLHIVWRKGTTVDPYIDKVEYLKVVNHIIILSEIPDSFYRVRITGMEEVNIDSITNSSLLENQFFVNYSVGSMQFHESKEAETINILYKGRGFIQYPSNRIYHQDKFNDVVKSLGDIIDESVQYLDDIGNKTSDYQSIKSELLNKLDEISIATDDANEAKVKANDATVKALDAYETTRLVFFPYVNTFLEIGSQHPSPEVGWTVQVYDSGIRYRYDGIAWIPIDLFGGNIPTATASRDGLMSKENIQQINQLETDVTNIDTRIDGVELDISNLNKDRVIIFVYPYLNQGVNSITARFPFNGTIKSVRGLCTKYGTDTPTEINIEKSADMIIWNSIFDNSYLTFDLNQNFDNDNYTLLINDVAENDLFRVNVRTLSTEIEGVTIEIVVQLN